MVSVIIDNYNYARFLKDAIESVLCQTYSDWELIIVDDGSTDESCEIIEKYQARYPKQIRLIKKENGGQASCFNAGVAASKGDVIAFLDSDDYWYPDKLEKVVGLHKTDAFVAHAKKFSDGRREIISTDHADRRMEFLRRFALFPTYNIITSAMSCTRELAKEIFPIPEEDFKICADRYVSFAALYFTNIKYILDELMFYRIHGSNAFISKPREEAEEEDQKRDEICISFLNRRLSAKRLPRVPHKSRELYRAMLKEAGEGFEIKAGEHYVIYGTADRSKKMTDYIEEEGGDVAAYCDSSEEKWGTKWNMHIIISPTELIKNRIKYDKIVIASQYFNEIRGTLEEAGMKRGEDFIYCVCEY